ncbi:hypothetical protein TVAG_110680 [Trichomonas vaginalis G3]|uniref:Right handed beta helix domain-containing protein n=1 Tax=Trichomonas vaginalis (strain ATCC PRA-98 / G3) TaxID=412133 RepID=A2DGR8_TRIV3|nr:hypothetical protein TVAGG3_0997350 [Trichomonas vaginalis G3]EAY20455.1 hypothetical protein TVAG_110680 [Trichomonas vaginalis G3]KAI5490495.1 hypothetical protein TVAGG3_0997350 [Trichomonas vaginalis G3]|eukprot:XP_001581441.1 hypothetical protein [Trichomonas vaginalis G3]
MTLIRLDNSNTYFADTVFRNCNSGDLPVIFSQNSEVIIENTKFTRLDLFTFAHFIKSKVSFVEDEILNNRIKKYFISACHQSEIQIANCSITSNMFNSFSYLEKISILRISDSTLMKNTGMIVHSHNSSINLNFLKILQQDSKDQVFSCFESNINMDHIDIDKSTFTNFILSVSNENGNIEIYNSKIIESNTVNYAIDQTGGKITVDSFRFFNFSIQNGGLFKLLDLNEANISNMNVSYASVSSYSFAGVLIQNNTKVNLSKINFEINDICPIYINNSNFLIEDSSFVMNHCVPNPRIQQSQSIFNVFNANSSEIKNISFVENSALNGAMYFVNSSSIISSSTFSQNFALESSCLGSLGSSITATHSKFSNNNSTKRGGVSFIKESLINFDACHFLSNFAPTGGVIFSENNDNIMISNLELKGNTANTSSSFIQDINSKIISLSNIRVDSDFDSSVSATAELILSSAKFNCKFWCKEVSNQKKVQHKANEKDKIESSQPMNHIVIDDSKKNQLGYENNEKDTSKQDFNAKIDMNPNKKQSYSTGFVLFICGLPIALIIVTIIIARKLGMRNINRFVRKTFTKKGKHQI